MNPHVFPLLLFLITLWHPAPAAPPSSLKHVDVFVSGQDGYFAYRIPAIETAPDGSLLAFAEARKHNLRDPGFPEQDIDLAFKRSQDEGKTWSSMTIIEDPGELWSAANPATLADPSSGRVWLFYLRCRPGRNTSTARPGTDDIQNMARFSEDQGKTWSDAMDVTEAARDMTDPQWRCSVPGPGGAIRSRGGRLLVPLWKVQPWGVLTMFSDDQGQTWQRGTPVPGNQPGNENQLVLLSNGSVLMDFRQTSGPTRWQAISRDQGQTWSPPRPGQTVTPVACAVEGYGSQSQQADRHRILWTGPKGPERQDLVVRISDDQGETFSEERLIYKGFAAYSDMAILKDGSVGILWERGTQRDYQFISFTRLPHSLLR